MNYVLGIDLGTSGMKGTLINQTGTVIATESYNYSMSAPQKGYSEQDPNVWIEACQAILKQMYVNVDDFGDKLEGISFSGQMHTLVTLDKENKPLYPAILWNDVRTTKQCQTIHEKLGNDIYTITKNRALEGFTLPKILWLQENEPHIWQDVHKIMMPKDYLGFWFTGNIYTEYSDAAGTLLLDIEKKEWSSHMLSTFNISKTVLPNLVSSFDCVGNVREEVKEQFHFKQHVKVFAGGADNACAALGAGLNKEGMALVSVGTSGVFSAFESQAQDYQGVLHVFNHAIPDAYYSMGVTLAAGLSLQWFKETFADDKSFDELLSNIDKINPSESGLYFTPYIVGERTPHFDSHIRGSFIGIDKKHQLQHFSRAVLEGITFSLKDTQIRMEQVRNQTFKQLISIGGGAKNHHWLQIQADIFNIPIIQLSTEQGASLGSCMIAGLGCGWFNTVEEAIDVCVSYKDEVIQPVQENVESYQEIYAVWKNIYDATKVITN